MARFTVRLPDTLHKQLVLLADNEGVSLNQYIVYTLARQVTQSYGAVPMTEEQTQTQRDGYAALLQTLGRSSYREVQEVLAERDTVEAEIGLTQETVQQLRERIAKYESEGG